MKLARLLLPVLAGTLLMPLAAQAEVVQRKLIEKRDKKLAEAFIKRAPWQLDFDAAKQQAQAKQRVILAYFTRSYAP